MVSAAESNLVDAKQDFYELANFPIEEISINNNAETVKKSETLLSYRTKIEEFASQLVAATTKRQEARATKSDLESALISNLQEFILELGMGFCFEERQKKLLIDDRYYKADLVFYHRILKRHVIIELKAHRLDYADVAQLNMYLAYYRKNIMLTDDNEPIGILLCSEVGQEMAEYTMMGADANLFLSKYQLELPSTEHFTEFLRKENEGLNKDINNQ
jgi:predicted nuclease of restriction endonuclease-like (RecB) superfamily